MVQSIIPAYDLLVVLGPTATGKTKLAVKLADKLKGEIISADSRQLYRGMDIGTGKDLKDYSVQGGGISFHLIDILDPGEEYSVFKFQQDFHQAASKIIKRKQVPILCGGTGLYIKSILMDFELSPHIPPNKKLRDELELLTLKELIRELNTIAPQVAADEPVDTKRRVIRHIEKAMLRRQEKGDRRQETAEGGSPNSQIRNPKSEICRPNSAYQNPLVLGVEYPREVIRERITQRLEERLASGMIDEVEVLLKNGVSHEWLEKTGLEYRFISRFLRGESSSEELFEKLNTAIHQFAKRQMTFFRNMEKNGIKIKWIPEGDLEKAMVLIKKVGK